MGLESGTYIFDLVTTNPVNSDLEAQGAAHLRLIKAVLQNTFPGASRPVGVDRILSKSADYSIVQGDALTTFLVDTTAAIVNLTLPTLASGDAGWQINVVKTNTGTNPILIKPPTGTLQSGAVTGLSASRRCIPGARTRVFWTGTAFICERALGVPVGTILEYDGATLPVGYEWPNGQTLSSASTNYPEFYSINGSSGVTLDRRQRIAAGSSLGGSNPSRISSAGSGIDGTTLGSAGGAQTVTIGQINLPGVDFTVTASITNNGNNVASFTGNAFNNDLNVLQDSNVHEDFLTNSTSATAYANVGTGGGVIYRGSSPHVHVDLTPSGSVTSVAGNVSGTAASGGSGTALNNMPPTIIKNFILVVE